MLNLLRTVKFFALFDWEVAEFLRWFLIIQCVFFVIEIALFVILYIRSKNRPAEPTVAENSAPEPPVRVMTGLSVYADRVKREFFVGEAFDYSGLVVAANFSAEPYEEIVTDYSLNVPDLTVEGQATVAVTYLGMTVGYPINIVAPQEEVPQIIEEPRVVNATQELFVLDEESVAAGTLRYDRSFTARLIQSDDEVKSWYTELKNYLLSYKKVKDRMSWKRETYKLGRNMVAKMSYRGKTLCLFLPLNPNDYIDSKFKVEDASENSTYLDTPCMYRIKNERRAKYAMELIDEVMTRLGGVKYNRDSVDYYLPYEGVVELIGKGLIKRDIKSSADEMIFVTGGAHNTNKGDE